MHHLYVFVSQRPGGGGETTNFRFWKYRYLQMTPNIVNHLNFKLALDVLKSNSAFNTEHFTRIHGESWYSIIQLISDEVHQN